MLVQTIPAELGGPALAGLLEVICASERERLVVVRAEHGDHYAARIYACRPCNALHSLIRPADELRDEHPCRGGCGRLLTPVTPAWIPV